MSIPRDSMTVRQGRGSPPSPALVVLVAWLVPGGGYVALGHKSRGITIGASIVFLFVLGILVGGIRVMDPPGWGQYGYLAQMVSRPLSGGRFEQLRVDPTSAQQQEDPRADVRDQPQGSALLNQPLAEISDKPWFVGQILCGPIALVASAISVREAKPMAAASGTPPQSAATTSHARSWEIGTLYTAVAGMLNLLAIIDAAFRGQTEQT
ncbi:MAG: DUF6677 family protein [Tepidisphaeraceae bacterium]|jgi:hypothetical protein